MLILFKLNFNLNDMDKSENSSKKVNSKIPKLIFIILGLFVEFLLCSGVGIGGYFLGKNSQNNDSNDINNEKNDEDDDEEEEECGMENCHGLDITCGSNVPDACTMEYQIGDGCRQYAKCEMKDDECVMKESNQFENCKSCVEDCLDKFENDSDKLFLC